MADRKIVQEVNYRDRFRFHIIQETDGTYYANIYSSHNGHEIEKLDETRYFKSIDEVMQAAEKYALSKMR